MIDLRSDTVTRPTPAMREAMLSAAVGDDVWGDDPTVLALQDKLAALSGKAAGLFLPTGTQSNLVALMAHCERGDEYIVGQLAHTYKYEGGGAAVLGSIVPQPIENEPDGSLPLAKIASAIKHHGPGMGVHFAHTKLLTLENTFHGQVVPRDYLKAATELAHSRGLATHLDGARVFNAVVAQGITLEAACEGFDSVSICLSKGLGAPVGSVLVGSEELIERAYRWRKVLGGGMRQSGILAAAGLYALEHHIERLADDHANAKILAEGLAALGTPTRHATNMAFATFPDAHCEPLETYLAERGMLASINPESRFVTHLDVTPEAIAAFLGALTDYFAIG
ncbi:low-specificity L-threonine aldolase [Armatimonas sp.]|uniref:low-specificity L-threonine aldolase n=1 Tax=Armatimonas sp. TaxID=1872638 RepID=UPI0034D982EA